MRYIKDLCEKISSFSSSVQKCESLEELYLEGELKDEMNVLKSLEDFLDDGSTHLESYITLLIDDESVSLSNFSDFISDNRYAVEFNLTIDTKRLIQSLSSGSNDIDEYLFTSVQALEKSISALGLSKPCHVNKINNQTHTRLHVFGLEEAFGGPRLAIVPVGYESVNDGWLKDTSLPSTEEILKQVHIVSSDNICISPRNYQLSWGNIGQPLADSFKRAYAQQLWASLSSIYYSDDKLQLKGVKHIEASIKVDPSSEITEEYLQTLHDSVVWCYGVEDPSIPVQLFVDRLSLEYKDKSLLTFNVDLIRFCLEQAKNNYKFVIAKRSDEYRKELKTIYTDIKSVTDKFIEKSASLSSEMLKSLMAIAFIFTAGTVSKAIVNGNLLHSKEGYLLFKIISIYLIVSFFIRWLNASIEIKIALGSLSCWSKTLHNYISQKEVDDLIKSQIKLPKLCYLVSLGLVTVVQFYIALAAFYIEGTLWFLNL
ncbi:hypothetical protein [Photobacterium damselae]|uniref:hypothetical protein n=1 Tax=Photobacterium damselae TaxID=38293 RepID=UPI0015947C0F|nr:hypothetical protein [Photobacterium damselae]NVH47349.1 hypothetical protein [Photobacterium damselae subsp. damselae]